MDDERPFLRQLLADPDDLDTRLVYADWLEERGECERAEFLRLECDLIRLAPTELNYLRLNERFHDLHSRLDPKWLALLDRTSIDNCRLQFEFRCPLRWEKLGHTDDASVRWCGTCRKEVTHCTTIHQARREAALGKCVAVDSRLTREPGDLSDLTTTETMLLGSISFVDDIHLPPEPPRMLMGVLPMRPERPPPAPKKRWWQFWK